MPNETPPAPADTATTAAPSTPVITQLYADIVMKGGITSGVVYPTLVKELSGTFKFRNIGGTSAGAIAAVATAAAELGRTTGTVFNSFDDLAGLPAALGRKVKFALPALGPSPTKLKSLFAPEPSTARSFSLLTVLVQEGIGFNAWIQAFISVRLGLLLTVVALVTGWLVCWHLSGGLHMWAWVITSLLTLVLAFILLLVRLVFSTIGVLQNNDFGLCTGKGSSDTPNPALTPWMEQLFDRLAGIPSSGPPLTFGDLWKGGTSQISYDPLDPTMPLQPAINLELMTSDLTLGLPVRMPFDLRRYFFRKEDMCRFFSDRVVNHLLQHPRSAPASEQGAYNYYKTLGYYLLPAPEDLPVVVAARMSLSFPILLSAVPLYAVDYSLPVDSTKAPAEQRIPERCWFSDGGITSNFPIHFFDRPLPDWPTFGINLAPFPPGRNANTQNQGQNIYFPHGPSQGGSLPAWTRLKGQSLPGFLGLILNTMQNWRDNAQCLLPGYRDRIVTVFLTPEEGGLNLDMPSTRIADLAARGTAAGQVLVQSFGHPATNNRWNAHRWTRFLSMSGMLSKTAEQFAKGFQVSAPWGSYSSLVAGTASPNPSCYAIGGRQRSTASAFSQALLAAHAADPNGVITGLSPRPRPVLRASPKV